MKLLVAGFDVSGVPVVFAGAEKSSLARLFRRKVAPVLVPAAPVEEAASVRVVNG